MERPGGPLRWASVPAESNSVPFGVHGAVADHYKARDGDYDPYATTLDYSVAAAAA